MIFVVKYEHDLKVFCVHQNIRFMHAKTHRANDLFYVHCDSEEHFQRLMRLYEMTEKFKPHK